MGQSASVSKTVTEGGSKASGVIDGLRASVVAQEGAFKERFGNEIIDSMNKSGIKDQKLLTENKDTQTEYASEFHMDSIKNIVSLALKAATATAQNNGGGSIELSDQVINSFVDLVGAICENAKTNASSAVSYSYLMNRLAPGLFVFICNSSISMRDEALFGDQTVITTTYYYKTMLSIVDIQRSDKFSSAQVKSKTLGILKETQVSNAQKLAEGSLSYEEWEKNEDRTSKAIERIQKELEELGFNNVPNLLFISPQPFKDNEIYAPKSFNNLEMKAKALLNDPKTHHKVVELFKGRYETGYFV